MGGLGSTGEWAVGALSLRACDQHTPSRICMQTPEALPTPSLLPAGFSAPVRKAAQLSSLQGYSLLFSPHTGGPPVLVTLSSGSYL